MSGFPVAELFPRVPPGLQWLLTGVVPGALLVGVPLSNWGCGGKVGGGILVQVFCNWVSCFGVRIIFLRKVCCLCFSPLEAESAPKEVFPPYCVLFFHGFLY